MSANQEAKEIQEAHVGRSENTSPDLAQAGAKVQEPVKQSSEPASQPASAPAQTVAGDQTPKLPDPQLLSHVKKQMDSILALAPPEAREELRVAMAMAVGPAQAPVQAPAQQAPQTQAPATQVSQVSQAKAQVQKPAQAPVLDLARLGIKKKYSAKLPAGYVPEAPGLLYTPAGNIDLASGKPRVLEGLCVEIVQWGGHAVIVMLPATDVRVIMPDGTTFDNQESEQVSRAPIVIPVDGDSSNIARDLMENPEMGIVACFVPSFEQPLADGTLVTRHLVGRGEVIPKKGIWPPE